MSGETGGETFGGFLAFLRTGRIVGRASQYGDGSRTRHRVGPMSQNHLATLADVDPAYIHRMERGTALPRREIVLRIADALEASPDHRDRLLFLAGYAPVIDWQMMYEDERRASARMRRAVSVFLFDVTGEADEHVRAI